MAFLARSLPLFYARLFSGDHVKISCCSIRFKDLHKDFYFMATSSDACALDDDCINVAAIKCRSCHSFASVQQTKREKLVQRIYFGAAASVSTQKMAKVPNVKLNNGKEIPIIGLGTLTNDLSEPGEILDAVRSALDVGYRHVDCAFRYRNEDEIGLAVREAIAKKRFTREEVFLTSKLWNTYHRREKVLECCRKSLADLKLDYLDLYLIHWPVAYKEGDIITPKNEKGERLMESIDFTETWKGMEDCYEKGLVKSIGLSNFNSLQIQRILDICKVKPVMLQVECHPYLNQNKLIEFCRKHEIAVTAYSPLGSPHRPWMKPDEPTVLEDQRIKKLALKYNKTPAQVCLRFNIQRGIVVIPKSITRERIQINFQVFDFELTEEEMDMIKNFKETFRYTAMTELSKDPNYPFNVEF